MAKKKQPEPEQQESEIDIPESLREATSNSGPMDVESGSKDAITRLTEAIESMVRLQMAQIAAGQTVPANQTEIMEKLSASLDRLGDNQLKGSELIARETQRAHRPSNEVVHNRSVFNRRGELLEDWAKPKLKCKVYMPWQLEDESLTREEVELINLLQPGVYTVKRVDNTKIRVTVKIDYGVDGKKPTNMVVSHETGFNNDNFKLMPPLADFVRSMLRQHDDKRVVDAARAIMDDETEEALIEAGEILVSQ